MSEGCLHHISHVVTGDQGDVGAGDGGGLALLRAVHLHLPESWQVVACGECIRLTNDYVGKVKLPENGSLPPNKTC